MTVRFQFESPRCRLLRKQAAYGQSVVYVDTGCHAMIDLDSEQDREHHLVTDELRSCTALALSYKNKKFLCHVSSQSDEEILGWIAPHFSKEELESQDLKLQVWIGKTPMVSFSSILSVLIKLNLFSRIVNFDSVRTCFPLLLEQAKAFNYSFSGVDKRALWRAFEESEYAQLLRKGINDTQFFNTLTTKKWRLLLSEIEKNQSERYSEITQHWLKTVDAEEAVGTQALSEIFSTNCQLAYS